MHVSCPMVLVINPIASSSSDGGDDGAGSNDGTGSNDGNGTDRATVTMDDAGEAVAGAAAAATSLGGGVEIVVVIGSSNAHRSTWNAMVACRSSSSPKWKLMANINPSHTSCSSIHFGFQCTMGPQTILKSNFM